MAKRFKLGKGGSLNIGKTKGSLSLGKKGASINIPIYKTKRSKSGSGCLVLILVAAFASIVFYACK